MEVPVVTSGHIKTEQEWETNSGGAMSCKYDLSKMLKSSDGQLGQKLLKDYHF